MAQRIARALLALLCVVAVVYGTAMFPAAFDVELRSDQPGGPSAPATPGTGTVSSDDGEPKSSDPTESGRSTASPSPTETSTPTPAASGGADDGDSSASGGTGGLFGLLALGLVGIGVLITVGAVAGADRRSPQWLPTLRLRAFASRFTLPALSLTQIPQLTTLVIISAGSGLARLTDDATTVLDAVGRSLAAGIGPVAGAAGRTMLSLPRAFAALVAAPVHALGAAAAALGSVDVGGFLGGGVSRPSFLDAEKPSSDARAERGPDPASDGDDDDPVESVVEAWVAMTELVTVRDRRTRTAVEYAQRAIDAGLPAEPVRRLTALFREVRYGGRSDSGERVTAARRALDALTGGDE